MGVIVYSCKTQQTSTTTTTETSAATANLSKEEMLKKGEDLFTLGNVLKNSWWILEN